MLAVCKYNISYLDDLFTHVFVSTIFLSSLRYHSFNPEYVHQRLKQLGHMYELRVLLVQVDMVNYLPLNRKIGITITHVYLKFI